MTVPSDGTEPGLQAGLRALERSEKRGLDLSERAIFIGFPGELRGPVPFFPNALIAAGQQGRGCVGRGRLGLIVALMKALDRSLNAGSAHVGLLPHQGNELH